MTSGLRSRAARLAAVARPVAALALALGLLGLGVLPPGALAPAGARAAGPDLTVVTQAGYAVQPDRKRVRVTVDATIANRHPETKTNRYYFDHAFLAVQPGAAGAALVTGPRGARVSVASRSSDATVLRLDFGGRLYGGSTTSLRFAFSLADTGSGVRRLVRVGASLIAFPVWAYASDGATGSRVTVSFPKGYDVTVETGTFASQSAAADGGTVLGTGALARPLDFFAYVSAQQPATYLTTPLAVSAGGRQIALSLRSWKDDPAWAGRVGGLFGRALPALQADIGLAWPHDGTVVVQEAVSRSAGGYAGLYDPQTDQIQVAYWASPAVIVHEAAHGWFNGSLLADRWAVEGFASLYAQRALSSLKIAAAAPALTARLKAAAFPLNAWPASPAPASAAESYGYAASYALASLIAQRAGHDALARVWADAEGGIGAYQPRSGPAAVPETVAAPPDWRGLLDLLEAETGRDFSDLWRVWVVRPGEAALLDQRATVLADYRSVVGLADDWSLPRSIRDSLRAWQFGPAAAQLVAARRALAERADLERTASSAGLALSGRMRALFEAGSFGVALAEAQAERAAIEAIRDAAAGRIGPGDIVATVGLAGADPERDLATARAALASGDPTAAVASADAASRAWADAPGEGRRRLLMGVSLAAALAVLGLSLASRLLPRLRRRGRGCRGRRDAVAPGS